MISCWKEDSGKDGNWFSREETVKLKTFSILLVINENYKIRSIFFTDWCGKIKYIKMPAIGEFVLKWAL